MLTTRVVPQLWIADGVYSPRWTLLLTACVPSDWRRFRTRAI